MSDTRVHLIDTTLRDGQASIWASRMRVGAMIPVMRDIDRAGFDSMEFVAPNSQFIRWAKDLGENPWDWVNTAVELAKKTELRLFVGLAGGTSRVPRAVTELLVKRFVDMGVTMSRINDQWHNMDRMTAEFEESVRLGIRPIPSLIYSISPHHTLDFYREKARRIKALDPFRACLKDVGGLLRPDTARSIMSMMVDELPGIDLEFHGHNGGSFGLQSALIAAEVGFRYIHTGIPPLANGGGQPSVFAVTHNLRLRGYEVDIDLEPLEAVSRHLYDVAEREDLPVGEIVELDERHFQTQLPGGMASHFRFQLSQLGLEHLWEEIMEEVVHVRADLGYPIMITPYAQWVGSQAAINVTTGTRYEHVTDQVIRYAAGFEWHKEGAEQMDPEVRALILSSARAEQMQEKAPWNPDLTDLRRIYDTNDDEELILRAYVGDDVARKVMEKERHYPSTYDEYLFQRGSLVDVLKSLDQRGLIRNISLRRGRSVIALSRSAQVGS